MKKKLPGRLREDPPPPSDAVTDEATAFKHQDRIGNLGERVAGLEAELKYLATKEDIQRLKVWALSGIIAGMGLAAMIALGVLRFFLPSSAPPL